MMGEYEASSLPKGQHGSGDGQAIAEYAALLADHHGQVLTPEAIDSIIVEISPGEGWLSSVDSRRPVFAETTRRVDAALGVETSNEVRYAFRAAVVAGAALGGPIVAQVSRVAGHDQTPAFGPERFLDTEIVAIYW